MTSIEKEELLCEQYNEINRFLFINGVREEEREDLLQEIFIKALRSLKQLKDVEKMGAWLRAISINEIRLRYNRENRHGTRVVAMTELMLEAESNRVEPVKYGQMIDEIQRLADEEVIEEIFSCFDEVTKVIFRLHYYLGYPFKEIAEMRQMNYSTVKSIHQRALKKMRNILLERNVGENG